MEVAVDGQYCIVRACCMVWREMESWLNGCGMALLIAISGYWLLTWCMGVHKF